MSHWHRCSTPGRLPPGRRAAGRRLHTFSILTVTPAFIFSVFSRNFYHYNIIWFVWAIREDHIGREPPEETCHLFGRHKGAVETPRIIWILSHFVQAFIFWCSCLPLGLLFWKIVKTDILVEPESSFTLNTFILIILKAIITYITLKCIILQPYNIIYIIILF